MNSTRQNRNYKKTKIPLLLVVGIFFTLCFIASGDGEVYPEAKHGFKFPFGKKQNYDNILVARVIDGDTIELQDGERVRLIGIDTPEAREGNKLARDARRSGRDYRAIIAMGERATKFTRSLAEGKMVRLEFDVEKRDKYGRLLAYVYLEDGRMLNAELLREGYAQVYTFVPNVKYVELFLKLQRKARENNMGFWKE